MQSYFLPYPGYFRLMCDVDAFVLINSVQFPRRGWVHRNRLRDDVGRLGWFTLPLAHMPTATTISNIKYGTGAGSILLKASRRFAACRTPRDHTAELVERALRIDATPIVTIEALLRATAAILGLAVPFIRDTDLRIPSDLAGPDRIFAICEALGANVYINPPGGRYLYDPTEFLQRGLKLEFLSQYQGDPASILQRLHDSTPTYICAEIRANLT